MRGDSFEPFARLRPHVKAIRVIATEADSVLAPLPEPGLSLGVRYAGRATAIENGVAREVPAATLSGIHPALRRIQTSADGGLVVAVFQSAGASQCFDEPLHELFEHMADLADVTSRDHASRLLARVVEGP